MYVRGRRDDYKIGANFFAQCNYVFQYRLLMLWEVPDWIVKDIVYFLSTGAGQIPAKCRRKTTATSVEETCEWYRSYYQRMSRNRDDHMVSTRQRVAHLSTVHKVNDTRIFEKECRSLADAGYDVTFVGQGEDAVHSDNLRVVGLPTPLGRPYRLTVTAQRLLKIAVDLDADLYHLHDPELVPMGIWLKKRHGKTVIMDVHEPSSHMLSKDYVPQWSRTGFAAVESTLLNWASNLFDGVVTANEMIADQFPSGRSTVLHNFPKLEWLQTQGELPYGRRENFLAYFGGLSSDRGFAEMVQAIGLVDGALNPVFVCGGTASPASLLEDVAKLPGWNRTEYLGMIPRVQVIGNLSRTRIGLCTLQPTDAYQASLLGFNKLFEYMIAGIPCVVSDFRMWREELEDIGCALFVDPSNPFQIAMAIEYLLINSDEAERMGQRGREMVINHFNWEAEVERLTDLYGRLLASRL